MSESDIEGLTREEFTRRAILRLRNLARSRGIHAVYSGFNNAFRKYFNDDPVEFLQGLAKQGKVEIVPRRGGVMVYLPGEAPKSAPRLGEEALSMILRNDETDPDSAFIKVIDELIPEKPDESP